MMNKREFVICFTLMMIILVVFWQVRSFEFIGYDDDRYVTHNHHVQRGLAKESVIWAFTAFHASNWHPLTWLSHMLDVKFFGLNPAGHHLTNLFFHVLSTLMLFFILKSMTGMVWKSSVVAALFAVHPLHVESVVWVAERKDVLSVFFGMAALWAYVRYTKQPVLSRYLPILLLFALGLMSKPMLVTLPFVLLLLDYWPLGRIPFPPSANANLKMTGFLKTLCPGSPIYCLVLEKVPFFLLSAASSVVTLMAQRQEIASHQSLHLSERMANAVVAYVGYIIKMIWPYPLAVFYPYPKDVLLWKSAGAGLFLIFISVIVIKKFREFPYLLVGWCWYLGTLVPVIGLVQVGLQSMADRYTYMPLIGLFIIIAWGLPDLIIHWRFRRIALTVAAVIVLSLLSAVAWFQLHHWRNSVTLFEHTLAVTRDNYVMHNNMGAVLAEKGKTAEAAEHYREALKIKPDDAEARYNLGNIMLRQGQFENALVQYAEVLRHKPDFASAHNNAGIALSSLGKETEAVPHFQEALRIDPQLEGARVNLEKALSKVQKPRGEGVSIPGSQADPASAAGQMHAGLSFVSRGRMEEAIPHFREALRINPNLAEAHVSLGLALAHRQKLDEAVVHFRKAAKLKPGVAETHNSLGVALAQQGNLDEAIPQFQEALRINPRFAKAHNSLGVVMARKGRMDDAVRHLREAVRLKPDYEEARRNLKVILNMQGKSETD